MLMYIKLSLLGGMLWATSALAQSDQAFVEQTIEQQQASTIKLAQSMWNWAELGFQEYKSSQMMQDMLSRAGFTIRNGVADMPTAFIASYGSAGPVIGILAEMDALPGLSQQALPEKSAIAGKVAGHACGHHLFAGGSVAAAIAIKKWLVATGTAGQVRLFGTPAEEGGSGKVYMVRAGLFDDVDLALHWHAGDNNSAVAMTSLANKSAKFRFKGIASHAAAAPERGRSALDAVEAMNYMVNMMREHVPSDSRIHYIITNGGSAPNIVPEFAEVYYYVRSPSAETVIDLWKRLEKTAKAAALGTETEVEWEVVGGAWDLLPNLTLAKSMSESLAKFGGLSYSAEEQAFADKLRPTLGARGEAGKGNEQQVFAFTNNILAITASTDVGDVSWQIPTAGLSTATWVPGTPPHSWQAVAAGGTSIGNQGMLLAAKALALSAITLYSQPGLIEQAKLEFKQRKGNTAYYPLIEDRQPALDYRK